VPGWLAPVHTEHALRVRILLALAGAVACLVGARMLVLGLSVLAFLPLGAPVSVAGFLAISFGLALIAQGLMPWETPSPASPPQA
jgi:hypothetical protein